jgi:hypothetical protein
MVNQHRGSDLMFDHPRTTARRIEDFSGSRAPSMALQGEA